MVPENEGFVPYINGWPTAGAAWIEKKILVKKMEKRNLELHSLLVLLICRFHCRKQQCALSVENIFLSSSYVPLQLREICEMTRKPSHTLREKWGVYVTDYDI